MCSSDLNHPDRSTAVNVAEAINQELRVEGGLIFDVPADRPDLAYARDARTVVVEIPQEYQDVERLMRFISAVEQIRLTSVDTEGRVVIYQDSGVVVINGNVTISEVAISLPQLDGQAIPAVRGLGAQGTPLQDLVDALNALKVSPQQLIQIIQALDRAGALHGRLEVM